MALEIERKFLVNGPGWKERSQNCQNLHQGYLAQTEFAAIRIRVIDGTSAFLTIKSANPGVTRTEFEYPIPVADAEALFMLRTGLLLEKQRHVVPAGGFTWEVDVFGGAHQGLVIAEIELPTADMPFERPGWVGAEVTADKRYYNADLALRVPPGD